MGPQVTVTRDEAEVANSNAHRGKQVTLMTAITRANTKIIANSHAPGPVLCAFVDPTKVMETKGVMYLPTGTELFLHCYYLTCSPPMWEVLLSPFGDAVMPQASP